MSKDLDQKLLDYITALEDTNKEGERWLIGELIVTDEEIDLNKIKL